MIQLLNINPNMFMLISKRTSLPRLWTFDVSVCHTGAVAVFIPFPILMERFSDRQLKTNMFMRKEPHPVTIRATIICATLKEDVCRIAPMAIMTVPRMMVFLRPSLSPIENAKSAPKKQPMV